MPAIRLRLYALGRIGFAGFTGKWRFCDSLIDLGVRAGSIALPLSPCLVSAHSGDDP